MSIEWYVGFTKRRDEFDEGLKISFSAKYNVKVNKNFIEKVGQYVCLGYDAETSKLVIKNSTPNDLIARKVRIEPSGNGTLHTNERFKEWLQERKLCDVMIELVPFKDEEEKEVEGLFQQI